MRAGLLLAAAGLMLLTACGGDDDAGDVDDAEPTEETVTAVPDEPTPTPEDAETPTQGADTGTDTVEAPPVSGEGTVPEGWEVVTDADGRCQMAVPEDWEEYAAGTRSSPNINAHAYLTVEEVTDWDEHKQMVRSVLMTGHVVVEDSDDLLYLQSGVASGDTAFYITRLIDGHACSVLVATAGAFYDDYDEIFAGILESVGPAD